MEDHQKLTVMRNFAYYLLLFLPVVSCMFAGCKKEEPFPDSPPKSSSRTVLVYFGVDNSFHAEAARKIEQLRSNWDSDIDGNLLVYADAGGKPVLIHIYHSERRGNVADTIELYPPENSANPLILTRVLNKVKAYRPAASYGLVVLSHATGWLPAGMSSPDIQLKAVIQDTDTKEAENYMELPDFAGAIPYKLDFIIFDACFMGSVEVCYELKEKTDYIVASPAEVLAPGFVYPTMMQHLFVPVPDLTSVARDFYEYHNSKTGFFRSATVGVVKTAGLEALADVVKDITLQNTLADDLENVQTYGYDTQKIYFDLGDCLQRLSHGNRQEILDRCVVYKECTPSYFSQATMMQPINTFSGLSVYIPQAEYPAANAAYAKLKWAARTGFAQMTEKHNTKYPNQ